MDVEWKAFELRPGTPPEGIPRPFKPGETNEFTGHMKDQAEAAGLTMRRQPLTPTTRPALEAAAYAKGSGKFDEYHKAMFRAFWEDGKNIGDLDVVRAILESCGLDWDEFGSAANRPRFTQQVDIELGESRSYGIKGIPAFILDRYLLMGAQPYEVFQQAMEQIQEDRSGEG